MAESSVSDFISLINQQIEVQETLSSHLSKIEGLFHIALSDYFLDCSKNIQYEYLHTLSELIYQARKRSEDILNFLLECQQIERKEGRTQMQ